MTAPTPFHLAAPAALLRTEKAPMRHLGLFGPNQSSPLDPSGPRDERAQPQGVPTGHPPCLGQLARPERSRVEWTGAGAAAGPGGGNPWASGPERSVRPSAAEGQRAGSAQAARKGESPADCQTPPAFAFPARATLVSVPKESRPGTKPEARTGRRPGAELGRTVREGRHVKAVRSAGACRCFRRVTGRTAAGAGTRIWARRVALGSFGTDVGK